MSLPIVGAVANVLTGPVGSVLSGVFGGVAEKVLQAPAKLFKGVGKAFKRLFGRKKRRKHQCQPRPQPFGLPQAVQQNWMLKGIGNQLSKITDQLGQISNQLSKLFGGANAPFQPQQLGQVAQNLFSQLAKCFPQSPAAPAAAPASSYSAPASSLGSSVEAGGAKIDGMMKQAEQLMLSENKADQLKGQKMMQDAQNMFSMLSNLIKAMGDMQRSAIQNMRA